MEYKIPECNMNALKKKLATIEKKCNKYGIDFSFKIVDEIMENIGDKNTGDYFYKFYVIDVDGIAKINDWEFLATIEHTENGNIIRQYNRDVNVPEYYRNVKPTCEHCKSDRYRKDTYLVYNKITQDIKQVGKSCLRDFTNGLSAEMVATYLQYFASCEKSEGIDYLSLGARYFDVKNYILNTIEVVKRAGFVSKQKAMDERLQSTASLTWKCMRPKNKYDREEIEKIGFILDNPENISDVENMLNWIKTADNTSDYIYNLQIACSLEYAEYRNMGIIASLPSAYYKAMNKIENEKKQNENTLQSDFFGNIGDKIQLENASINFVSCYETMYGVTHIYKIQKDNFTFIWRTANSFENADNVTVKGTIKNHNIFGGEKQTELTRCKIITK